MAYFARNRPRTTAMIYGALHSGKLSFNLKNARWKRTVVAYREPLFRCHARCPGSGLFCTQLFRVCRSLSAFWRSLERGVLGCPSYLSNTSTSRRPFNYTTMCTLPGRPGAGSSMMDWQRTADLMYATYFLYMHIHHMYIHVYTVHLYVCIHIYIYIHICMRIFHH